MRSASYILPFKAHAIAPAEFVDYIDWLGALIELILVDGSPDEVFEDLEARISPAVSHIRPDARFAQLRNGKVRGVLTGLRAASHELLIVADDDVRYTEASLSAVLTELATADVIRPQNYFSPLPWHARLDTARSLINRAAGGDWPGTLGVRRSVLARTDGYDGNVLFENLELVRTVEAAGGVATCPLGLLVRRLPPRTGHYWSQRVRQAYDEFARPIRLTVALAGLPVLAGLLAQRQWSYAAFIFVVAPILVAELGRRRTGGTAVFPRTAALAAPFWVLERAVCAWLAVAARVGLGGVPYHGHIVSIAAHSARALEQRQFLIASGLFLSPTLAHGSDSVEPE